MDEAFGSPGLLGVSFLEGWSAAQARRRPGSHHGHGRQNQRAARRKCPVSHLQGERCCQLAHCLASGEKQTCRKELIFQMATVIATRVLAVCNRPHFSIFRAVGAKIGRHLSFFPAPDPLIIGQMTMRIDVFLIAKSVPGTSYMAGEGRISLPLPND